MNPNTRDAIIGASFCLMLGMACLATGSAEPLWILLAVVVFIILGAMI